MTTWDPKLKRERSVHVDVDPKEGLFQAKAPAQWAKAELYYTGATGYADCVTEVTANTKRR